MSKMKTLVTGSALGVAILAGPVAAETTGTVNITSEYMFRGVVSEGGAAVQGSLDWSDPSGLYVGAWASNSAPAGGTELDLYGGYTFTLMEGVEADLGAIYYVFSEDEETTSNTDLDYWEVYAGVTAGGFGAKLYYADNYFNIDDNAIGLAVPVPTDAEATYFTVNYDWVIKEGLDLNFQIGLSDGDGVERFLAANGSTDNNYTDWSVTLTKALDNGFSASFAYVQTNIEAPGPGGFDDDPKFVVSLAKGFEI